MVGLSVLIAKHAAPEPQPASWPRAICRDRQAGGCPRSEATDEI